LIEDPFEVEYKKSITLWELFTFQAGISTGVNNIDPFLDSDLKTEPWKWIGFPTNPSVEKLPNLFGRNLQESLWVHTIHPERRGNWTYQQGSNILSYVMYEATGMYPIDFVRKEVFPYIGLTDEDIDWDVNDEGMQTAYSSMRLSAYGIAKLTMLFKQEGKSSPDHQLLPPEFVEIAISPIQYRTFDNGLNRFETPYYEGFRWEVIGPESGYPPDMINTGGAFGQKAGFSFSTNRLYVIQRSNTYTEAILQGLGLYGNAEKFSRMAMNSTAYTFEVPEPGSPEAEALSGTFSAGGNALFHMVAVSIMSFIALWM